ncbi:MAG: DUF4440 domain-containing protein [Novosphingobium sp. 28-62-57]|uniref:YybH family protein n=1 Tax=unclassified Novosphingobium TaxID=2644732 RepID=UPI000BD944DB|nr:MULTISPECIES: nuclear transport factor 2 family protein [unclassified Novosphingobium]OYW49743.1 MAG: DUF4440 domain-containing protein [Novosphingobium sp. 12-62-10]OYZ12302.1 MAG: DUF4440 domain-containing protein [Novosphingobium sp. 28-62-57]
MTFASEAELQVRLRRAAFNRALAEADFVVLGTLLAPDVVLVTGTDSAVIAGRKAQLAAWKREFSANPRTIYTRTTTAVIGSEVEPIAMEHGQWQGVVAGTERVAASGTYAAKWRHLPQGWMLIAEIFVTLG